MCTGVNTGDSLKPGYCDLINWIFRLIFCSTGWYLFVGYVLFCPLIQSFFRHGVFSYVYDKVTVCIAEDMVDAVFVMIIYRLVQLNMGSPCNVI